MKKCPGCEREIDKYGIACQYCGKLLEKGDSLDSKSKGTKAGNKNPESKKTAPS